MLSVLFFLWIDIEKPIHWLDFNPIDPNFKVEMRPGDPAGAAHIPNFIARMNLLPGLYINFGLVTVHAVDTPAVINDGRVPMHIQ